MTTALAAFVLGGCAVLRGRAAPDAAPPAEAPAAEAPQPPPEPKPRVVIREVPVRKSCVPKAFPAAPRYPDTDAALKNAGGAADRYQLMAAGRLLRIQRLAQLERLLANCR